MNPKHPELLKAALLKFEFLTHRQIKELFRGQIHGRSIRRCISILVDSGFAQRHHYIETSSPMSFLARKNSFIQASGSLTYRFNHRVACTDALLALARRSFVSSITAELLSKNVKLDSLVIGRKPDGAFTLERGDDPPIEVALEVETTLRNRDRIQAVIDRYTQTFAEDPDRLSGVLIIAITPDIFQAYREIVESVHEKYRNRFVISKKLDITDVKDTLLGATCVPLSNNPKCPLGKRASAGPSNQIKHQRRLSPPPTGHTQRNADRAQTYGNQSEKK
jgi:hypothetical protein